jgi:shikimate kinase/3-dehydroquinate synthase
MPRPLLLNGFMGAGKSSVGRVLAERAGCPFVDLDRELEARLGRSIPEFFAERGEPAFRELEREVLLELLAEASQQRRVVALGGGALLDRSTRLEALTRAVVVSLKVRPETVAQRAAGQPGRPLLDGESLLTRAQGLLSLRAPAYAEAHAVIETDELSPEQVAARVLEVWQAEPVAVAVGEQSYAVEIGAGLLPARVAPWLRGHTGALLVTDKTVRPLHGEKAEQALSAAGVAAQVFELEPGEQHKNPESLLALWNAALSAGLDRRSVVVALGGGVVTDMAGFAAATWMRGVDWVALPSTLLSMVDASVGGKTAVDLGEAKNCVGAFWQPRRVFCDVELLQTESPRGFRSALAEVVKTALIGDPELYALLERTAASASARDLDWVQEIVRRSVQVKARIVSLDPREGGLRAVLNLGHTIGHALEAHAGYSELLHGEAVSLGLVAALGIGERLGLTPRDLARDTVRLLGSLGLPTLLDPSKLRASVERLALDKKRTGGSIRFIVAEAVGKVESVSLPLPELERLTEGLAAGHQAG